MEQPTTSTTEPSLSRVSSSLGMSLLMSMQQSNGNLSSGSSAQDPPSPLNAQAIVDAAAAAAIAAGSTPYRRVMVNEDMLWMPAHRPLVGGGAAAAFEALRHDYYVTQREAKMRQMQQERVERQNSGEPSSGPDNVARLNNNHAPPPQGNASMNPRQHFEMLRLHHMNLLNEMQETSLMMNLFQQQQLQQQQMSQVPISALLSQQANSPNVAAMMMLQQQQQLYLQQQQTQNQHAAIQQGLANAAGTQAQQIQMVQQQQQQQLQMMQQQQSRNVGVDAADQKPAASQQRQAPPTPLLSHDEQQQLQLDDDEDDDDDDSSEDDEEVGDGGARVNPKRSADELCQQGPPKRQRTINSQGEQCCDSEGDDTEDKDEHGDDGEEYA